MRINKSDFDIKSYFLILPNAQSLLFSGKRCFLESQSGTMFVKEKEKVNKNIRFFFFFF